VERAATRDALLGDMSIRPVIERWANLAVAVVGVGASPAANAQGYPSVMGQLDADVRASLVRLGVVGDVCAHMVDIQGQFLEHEVRRRPLGIAVDALGQVPRVIAVAGGASKAESLVGGARTGIVHILITAQLTAERMLELN